MQPCVSSTISPCGSYLSGSLRCSIAIGRRTDTATGFIHPQDLTTRARVTWMPMTTPSKRRPTKTHLTMALMVPAPTPEHRWCKGEQQHQTIGTATVFPQYGQHTKSWLMARPQWQQN